MLPRALLATAFTATAIAACTPPESADPAQTCPAPLMQDLIGEPLAAISVDDLHEPHRIIGPDMAVTMDWNPDRLNIEHDADEIITRIHCG